MIYSKFAVGQALEYELLPAKNFSVGDFLHEMTERKTRLIEYFLPYP